MARDFAQSGRYITGAAKIIAGYALVRMRDDRQNK